ncbi:VanW family protein [Paenibacillus hexagrammi]|uniref:VanW family protein n=1 Tax=Paenibacillus hexagrammi TaxID=2908839 RepID=A0ABY3SS33_9BACL|nr:VanW family protein [Paenibacillus sp. YPD9-1]UJF36253.1 VanW family protein [Paenibacillus sp. YPD9-1]
MNPRHSLAPRHRSAIRTYMGVKWFRLRRYMNWYLSRTVFASTKHDGHFPHLIFRHQTPLLRELRNVDMWMQHNKVVNVSIAAPKINGMVIRPSETFSYWKLIGTTSRLKGYKKGMVLSHGQVVSGVGGGLCQLSNLIYWMTLHTPLTVTERHRHSYDVFPDTNRNQPFGSGATCFYNYMDLQICNESDRLYQLIVYLTDTHLVGEWRSDLPAVHTYEIYEKNHWITQEYWGGYVRHNTIFRKVWNHERELVRDEYVTENHAIMMYEPLLAPMKQEKHIL